MSLKNSVLKIEGHDPIGDRLVKAGFTPVKFGVFLLILNFFVDSALGAVFNVFFSDGVNPGLLQDLTAISFDFLIQPLICGAYIWSALAPKKLLLELERKKIIKNITSAKGPTDEVNKQYKRYNFFILSVTIGIFFAFAQAFAYMGWLPWTTFSGYLYQFPPMSFARVPFWFFTFYGIAYGIFNVSITSSVLGSIFSQINNININLLHPDKCGGLGIVGNYASKTGYVILPIGLFASFSAILEIQNERFVTAYPIHLFIIFYVLLAPVVFMLPVWKVHKAMSIKKHKELLKIANHFQDEYDKKLNKTKQASLDGIMKLYQMTLEKYPDWPFNFGNLRRLALTITSPFIPILVSIVTDILTNALI